MKRWQIAAMAALLALGFWLAAGPALMERWARVTPGADVVQMEVAGRKIRAERMSRLGEEWYRFLTREPDLPAGRLTADEYWGAIRRVAGQQSGRSAMLTALNISSWWGMAWVALGFVGQGAFFGRMAAQWLASERAKRSVVPPVFWWLSLFGGVALFVYFVWRKDPVGVMGQSAGVVIYARNLRLIYKERGRQGAGVEPEADASPEPV